MMKQQIFIQTWDLKLRFRCSSGVSFKQVKELKQLNLQVLMSTKLYHTAPKLNDTKCEFCKVSERS